MFKTKILKWNSSTWILMDWYLPSVLDNLASGKKAKRACNMFADQVFRNNQKGADNSLTGAVLAMSRGDGLYQGWGGGELDIWGDTQPRSPFSSAQTPRHISQTQLSTWYCNTPGISASAPLSGNCGMGSARWIGWWEIKILNGSSTQE